MPITVTSNFVPSSVNFLHELRKPVRNPSKDEERCTSAMLIEKIEYSIGVRNDTAFHRCPVFPPNVGSNGFSVKIIFDINGETVLDGHFEMPPALALSDAHHYIVRA
jgi:hypothetical protein